MDGADWDSCYGEVFEIYRAGGPGAILVGDMVGLHYPRERGNWLGCFSSKCNKATCPGSPTTYHGFQSEESWYNCRGEVYKIYSTAKSIGSIINSDDDVALYFLLGGEWVSLGREGDTVKRSCLGTARPPTPSTIDNCSNEMFRVWKRE